MVEPGEERIRRWAPALAVALAALLPFLNALGNNFVYDDLPLVPWNTRVNSGLSGLPECLSTPYWGQDTQTGLYRPLVLASFNLNYALGDGPDATRFIAVNLLLHALVSLLVLALARELGAREGVARAAALLFAIHPVHTEAVTWVSGRAELLCAAFGIATLLAHRQAVRADSDRRAWAWRAATALALLAALGSKEHGITLLGVLVALDLLLPVRATGSPSRWLKDYALLVLATATYLALRVAVLGGAAWSPQKVIPLDNPLVPHVRSALGNLYGATLGERILTAVANLSEPLRVLVWPARLSLDHSHDQLPLLRSVQPRAVLGGLLLVGTAAGVWACRRRAPLVSFALAFLALTWSISSNLVVVIGTVFAERLLYLPSVGFALLVALLWGRLARGASRPWHRQLAVGLLAAAALLGAFRIGRRNRDWHDRRTIWLATVQASPNSARAHLKLGAVEHDLGEAFHQAGRTRDARPFFERAERHLARSLEIYPEGADTNLTLASARLRLGHVAEALPLYARAITLQPGHARAWLGWSDALLRLGRRKEALHRLRQALEVVPPDHPQRGDLLSRAAELGN